LRKIALIVVSLVAVVIIATLLALLVTGSGTKSGEGQSRTGIERLTYENALLYSGL